MYPLNLRKLRILLALLFLNSSFELFIFFVRRKREFFKSLLEIKNINFENTAKSDLKAQCFIWSAAEKGDRQQPQAAFLASTSSP